MNNWEDDALVLSRTFYSETSLILKVFSKHYGVRKGLVKGGKKINASYIFLKFTFINPVVNSCSGDLSNISISTVSNSIFRFMTYKIYRIAKISNQFK